MVKFLRVKHSSGTLLINLAQIESICESTTVGKTTIIMTGREDFGGATTYTVDHELRTIVDALNYGTFKGLVIMPSHT